MNNGFELLHFCLELSNLLGGGFVAVGRSRRVQADQQSGEHRDCARDQARSWKSRCFHVVSSIHILSAPANTTPRPLRNHALLLPERSTRFSLLLISRGADAGPALTTAPPERRFRHGANPLSARALRPFRADVDTSLDR